MFWKKWIRNTHQANNDLRNTISRHSPNGLGAFAKKFNVYNRTIGE